MRESERKQLLARIDKETATVGTSIPDEVEVQGETIELASFVFDVKRHDTIPDDLETEVEHAKQSLRRERKQRRERIEDGDISYETGDREADVIIGIDRALHALESLGETNIEAEERARETADKKRWVSFVQSALGNS
ncbi:MULTISPECIES: DUF5788 family protein [Halobacterium]|nr:DUF5788 family protein [Halobacterium salinarum]MBB6089757.1 hypothetical protein [Halobacterium salinarum]MDL0124092.1 DUF5788 family protein [Halobacterium salinarum]MDL0127007.1 DUF5788 family protein [Halobacterium salinarum]MDL0129357.1 DUF5788 family protein [Halobacterium salinarum]MDL0135573.1 DUF5788 family protein [Halobacterium salinarum]